MSGIRKRAFQENERVIERKLEEGIPQTTNHVCVYAYIAISQPAAAAFAARIYRCSYFITGGKNIQRNFRETVDGNKIYVRLTSEHSNTRTHTLVLKLNHMYTLDGVRNHADKLIHFSESKCAIDIGK